MVCLDYTASSPSCDRVLSVEAQAVQRMGREVLALFSAQPALPRSVRDHRTEKEELLALDRLNLCRNFF